MAVPNPWLKRAAESDPAYRAFEYYRDIGPDRTTISAYRQFVKDRGTRDPAKGPPKQVPGTWKKWKQQHEWDLRCHEFDRRSTAFDPGKAERQEIAAGAVASAAYDVAVEGVHQIIGQYLANQNRLAGVANRAVAKAEELLELPVTQYKEFEDMDGQPTVVHQPAETKHFTAASNLLRAASQVHSGAASDIMALVLNRKIEPVGAPDDSGDPPTIVYTTPDGLDEMRAKVLQRGHGPNKQITAPTGA